jgi:hypothetical protein
VGHESAPVLFVLDRRAAVMNMVCPGFSIDCSYIYSPHYARPNVATSSVTKTAGRIGEIYILSSQAFHQFLSSMNEINYPFAHFPLKATGSWTPDISLTSCNLIHRITPCTPLLLGHDKGFPGYGHMFSVSFLVMAATLCSYIGYLQSALCQIHGASQ